jgi:hypothetical protein
LNYVFLKAGHNQSSIAFDTIGTMNEVYGGKFSQFSKAETPFKVFFVDGEMRVIESRVAKGQENQYKVFDFTGACRLLEQYQFVFFAVATGPNDLLNGHMIMEQSQMMVFDEAKAQFFCPVTQTYTDKKNLISLFCMYKLNKGNSYVLALNSITNVDFIQSNTSHPDVVDIDSTKVIISDDGNSIRSRLLSPIFSENVKQLDEREFNNSQTIFARSSGEYSLKIFSKNRYFEPDLEFISGFNISVDSDLTHSVEGDIIRFVTPKEAQVAYLKVRIHANEFYDNVTRENAAENLSLNYLVIVK